MRLGLVPTPVSTAPATSPLVRIGPDKVSVGVQFTPHPNDSNPRTEADNVNVYVTLLAVPGTHQISDDATQGYVLGVFGCAVGNLVSANAAPAAIVYQGVSCNFTPAYMTNMIYDASRYRVDAVANVVYVDPVSGSTLRTTSKRIRATDILSRPVLPADLTSTLVNADIRGKKFTSEVDFSAKATDPSGYLDPAQMVVTVMAQEHADDVGVLISLIDPGGPGQANPPVLISCAVGSLEAGQAISYQGQSCNLPPWTTVTDATGHPKRVYPSLRFTVHAPPPQAQISVVYAGGGTCWSRSVPVGLIPAAAGPEGGAPPSDLMATGMTYWLYEKDDANRKPPPPPKPGDPPRWYSQQLSDCFGASSRPTPPTP